MKKLLAAAAIAALAFTAHAQDKKPADKTVGAVGKASAVYVVEAIDQATRKVVLKDAAGQTLTCCRRPKIDPFMGVMPTEN